jgi:aminopeptidase N
MRKVYGGWSVRCLILLSAATLASPQARRPPSSIPKIDVEKYFTQVTLNPEAHELAATVAVSFKPLEETSVVVFEVSENISIQKVVDSGGVELDFGQDEAGPGLLAVRFAKPLQPGKSLTIKVECTGGFDRDRYSRFYTRDETSAYIGPEGSYLLYSAKWFPVGRYLAARSPATIEATVPLGTTVIGAGKQLPVITKGITETFTWATDHPVLPNSIVAGQYFEKQFKVGTVSIDCFASEKLLGSMQRSAEALGQMLEYFKKSFGPSASGDEYRLVEVDDRLSVHPGTLGTIFITRNELAMERPAVRALARRAANQWWGETVGVKNAEDLWLVGGLDYYSSALYSGETGGVEGFRSEMEDLAVLALRFENRSPVRGGFSLGYQTEPYESVVAGKGAWVLNMLRSMMGDPKFSELLRRYAQEFGGKGSTTAGFQKLAEEIYGKELGWFFGEWLDNIGVPNLQTDYVVYKGAGGFRVTGTVKQDRDLFRMPVDIEVQTADKPVTSTIELSGKSTSFDIATFSMPKKVITDPGYKILRDSKELQFAVQLSLGNDLKAKGQFVEAIRAYENALKINPRKSLAHFRMAEVFYEQANLQSAANSFRDALNGDKDPKWVEVWAYIYLGKIYDILGQRQRAMAEYNKALNTKDDTFGAQEEAKKYLSAPYVQQRSDKDQEAKQPD